MTKLYQALASRVHAMANCNASGNSEWLARHRETAEFLVREYMPRGSGFDAGVTLDFDKSNSEKLVFHTSFHHMDGNGFYDGWTDHTLTVRPSLQFGIALALSGKDRNGFKDYAYDTFRAALTADVRGE